ncbi:MAG: hypothetical protein H6P98_1402 [Candidatus Aminicenantes bacterium]|nr:hypothetical protein [Candidatus Aminicenantes bacterium]
MIRARKTALIAVSVLWAGLFVFAQQPADMAGIWSGEATLTGMDEPNIMTLKLELKEGKLAGHMTDQFGAVDADLKDIVLEGGIFNFTVPLMLPQGGEGRILFKMKLAGEAMNGEIEIPEMSATGTWEATKQK